MVNKYRYSVVLTATITAVILAGSVSLMTLQHQAFALGNCGACISKFLVLTRSYGADAGKIILSSHSFPISQFIQLNLQFTKDIIKAVYAGHATHGDPVLPDLVNKYGNDLLNLNPPESINPLLKAYQQGVLDIFFP
jgi:hypothetical protein